MKKRIGAIVACALLAASVSSCSGVATSSDKPTVSLVNIPGFDDTAAVNALWTELLDKKGFSVEAKNVDLAAGYSGVARGDIDAVLNAWLPTTHSTYVDKYRSDLVVAEKPFYDKDELVLVVPDYVEENTIEDVVKNSAKYGSKIIGIEAGSGEMRVLPDVLKKYGAQDILSVVPGSTPATLAALQSATEKKEAIVATLWTPHWAFSSMPIKVLEDNKEGWPAPDGSYVVFSKNFSEKQPDVVKWMSKMTLTDEQYSSLMFDVNHADSPVEGARKWLDTGENRKVTDKWFE